jgi:cell division protein FtsW
MLILVLIPGIGVVRGGARSWIGFGSFSIQPAEFMKLAIILLIAKYLSNHHKDLKKPIEFIKMLILIVSAFGLIMLQPDFGTGLVLVVSCILLLFNAGVPLKYFLILLGLGIIGIIALIASAPYRLERIFAFLDPWSDPLGSGFQSIQSLFAIAPSGLFGLGYNNSMQKHFFLPEPQNDFIFAIICEEFGLIGGLLVIGVFLYIVIEAVKISLHVDNKYLKFLSLGIGLSLFTQVFINIGVVIGLLPVTGITLPILSYGGSSLVLTLMFLGLIINISQYTEEVR